MAVGGHSVSGNSVALKSFQSFAVNEGLLARTVEAIKAGEKEARTSGVIQSFEVFYRGFRQNISIGKVYVIPPSVAGKKGQDFPTALLYGCLVRTYGGEEIGDLIDHKIGDSYDFDEYSQADYDSIKEELFGTGEEGKYAALIIFAPNWVNRREYIGFQFPKDDNKLSNLTRHLIFSAYFRPALSSAFDALMTDVDTSKFDVTDITPKLEWPAITANPLREYPALTKYGSKKSSKPTLRLTIKTADEVTKEVLEPQEMDVFDSLDTALRNSLMPNDTESVGEAGDRHEKGFKAPAQDNEVPRLASGEAHAVHETPITNVGPGTGAAEAGNQRTEGYVAEKDVPKAIATDAPIGIALDETGVPRRPEEERKAAAADKNAKRMEFTPKCDVERMKGGSGLDMSAAISAGFDKARTTGNKQDIVPTEVKEYYASMNHDNQAHHAVADHQKDIAAGKFGDNPLSMSAALKKVAYVAHVPGHKDSKGNAAPWVVKDHKTGKIISSHSTEAKAKKHLQDMHAHEGSKKADMEGDIKKNMSQARQGQDAINDHNAAIDANKWGGISHKQASQLWAGSARKVAETLDDFTSSYIETALWSTSDNSDPSGGQPLDANYDIRDLAPSCLARMQADCAAFQEQNRELLDAAWNNDNMDTSRQGHDFWLTRNGHGAGFWDGDYPTTGDGLTEASKKWGEVDLYVGDDDSIYQMGSENFVPGTAVQPRRASARKVATETDASYVASLLAGSSAENYDARSSRSKSASEKREEEMAKKYASQRRKLADVAQTEEDIWEETMDDIGPAPLVRLPGDGESDDKQTTGKHEINAPEAPADFASDEPENTKGDAEEPTVEVEEALENETTKEDEPRPSTGGGGMKSEWGKGRGKSEKSEEKSESEESEEKPAEEESKEASAKTADGEFDGTEDWNEGAERHNLLAAQQAIDNDDEVIYDVAAHFGQIVDNVKHMTWFVKAVAEELADRGAEFTASAHKEADGISQQPVFYECGSCGGTHPSMQTSEALGLGWDGDCRNTLELTPDDIYERYPDAIMLTLEDQMAPDFDEAILASSETGTFVGDNDPDKMAAAQADCANCGAEPDFFTYDEEGKVFCTSCGAEQPMSQDDFFGMDEASPDPCNHQPHDADTMQSVCEVCGQEIYYDADHDYWTVLNAVEASAKQADTADNPANEDDGAGAIEVKTDHEISNTHGDSPKYDVTGSEKTADTADNPANQDGGDGAMNPKTDHDKKDTSGPEISNVASKTAGESKIFDTSTEAGLKAAERYQQKLYSKYDKVTVTPAGLDRVKVEGKTAGRDRTPKYVIRIPGSTDAGWDVGKRGQIPGAGKPNNANLARYMEALLKSMEPGGSNEHLKGRFNPTEAAVYVNDGSYKNPLATWSVNDSKQAADVSGDMSEAKSEVVSPDTVDQDIQQPTESVGEAGERHTSADVTGDISEAQNAVDMDKSQIADETKATDTVNPDHFATEGEGGEFPYVETLSGMGWDDTGDPGVFMHPEIGNRIVVLTFSDGYEVYVDEQLYEKGDNVDELQNTLEMATELGLESLTASDKTAAFGDEEDEERPIDSGLGDLADLVIEQDKE